MASLFLYAPDGSGDVICGEYTAETETDEDNITWTSLDVTDVYTGKSSSSFGGISTFCPFCRKN